MCYVCTVDLTLCSQRRSTITQKSIFIVCLEAEAVITREMTLIVTVFASVICPTFSFTPAFLF